jgi:hypothetical protein
MRYLGAFLAALLLTVGFPKTPKAQAAETHCVPYNGGVIILKAEYSYYSRTEGVKMLIIIASDEVIAEITERLTDEENIRYIHLDKSRLNMQLEAVNDDELEGTLLGDGTSVIVATPEYAASHGF